MNFTVSGISNNKSAFISAEIDGQLIIKRGKTPHELLRRLADDLEQNALEQTREIDMSELAGVR